MRSFEVHICLNRITHEVVKYINIDNKYPTFMYE